MQFKQDQSELSARDYGTKRVYEVSPETPLAEVASAMGKNRYGCAIVTKGDQVVGIFTTVDACKVLANVMKADN